MSDPLAVEKAYLAEHQAELAKQYPGQFLLVKKREVRGAFSTYEQAVNVGAELFGTEPFLVRSVSAIGDPEPPSIPALCVGLPFVVHTNL